MSKALETALNSVGAMKWNAKTVKLLDEIRNLTDQLIRAKAELAKEQEGSGHE